MIRITWNNLMPPNISTEDIVNHLIVPAIFNNPELGNDIKSSIFYTKNGKNIIQTLSNKTARNRFFSSHKDSQNLAKRMLNLLLLKTSSEENIPYNLHTFPIRQEFKRQWKKLLTNKNITFFKKYINLFFEDKDLSTLANELKHQTIGKGVTRNFEQTEILDLDNLLKQIKPYTDETDDLFYERLATLSILACTWYIWEHHEDYKEQLQKLSQFILLWTKIPQK